MTIFGFMTALASGATIDEITLSTLYGYTNTSTPSDGIIGPGLPAQYLVSDGTSWGFGAGYHSSAQLVPTAVSVTDNVVSFSLTPVSGTTVAMDFTDYDNGDHSAQGELDFASPLTLTAEIGSKTATLDGYLLVASNDVSNYSPPSFVFFASGPGSIVPFQDTYTLQSGLWTPTTFASNFDYTLSGAVYFSPEPGTFWVPLVCFCSFLVKRTLSRLSN
jgi:hypothetical protein